MRLLRGGGSNYGVYPLLFLVWIWGFGRTLPYGADVLPKTAGLDAYGGLTLTAVYAAARVLRGFKADEKNGTWWVVAAIPILGILTGIGLGDYNSPFAFALAAACFFLFLRVQVHPVVGRVVTWLGPSMFSVYLLHTNELGGAFIKWCEKGLETLAMPPVCSVLLAAVCVFAIGCALDLPRRLIVHLCGNCLRSFALRSG